MNALRISAINPDRDNTSGSQFSYTAIWRNLVTYIRFNVESKRHQVRMRTYGNCFTGCDLVDVVYHHLQMEKHVFTKTVTRDKASKVCQVLLDNDLIVFVCGSGKFEDSPSKLFRFSPVNEEKENECDVRNVTELKPFSSKSTFISTQSLSENPYNDIRKNVTDKCKTVQRRSSFSAERLLQRIRNRNATSASVVPMATSEHRGTSAVSTSPCQPRDRRSSLPDDDAFLPEDGVCEGEKKDVEENALEVLMEECLSQLTALMDLPMLDSILQVTLLSTNQLDTSSASAASGTAVENPYAINRRMLSRFESIAVIMSEENWRSWDPLWLAGLQCLDLIPDGSTVLNASLSQSTPLMQKLSMYQGICDHYTLPRKPPLWSSAYSDIHLGIYSLLMKGVEKEASVVRALQLSLHLLDGKMKDEMKVLLRFLDVVTASEDVHISRLESNGLAVSKAFSRAFIQDRLLTDSQVGQLVHFMVSHSDQLWVVPDDVQLAVDTRRGKAIATSKGSTFCMKISLEEFNRQKKIQTSDELVKMMLNYLADPVVAVKVKRNRLEQFRTHHPELFARHLSVLQV